MRFVDFLKATVVLCAGVATALAAIAVVSAASGSGARLVAAMIAWWALATALGLWIGRRAEVSPAIARLLAAAKSTTVLPPLHPATTMLNRLWPLLVFAVLAGGLGFLAAQIPGIGAGFAIIWALAWRHQHEAVVAIEGRDGVRFFVKPTSPVRPIELQRAPGFKAMHAERPA